MPVNLANAKSRIRLAPDGTVASVAASEPSQQVLRIEEDKAELNTFTA